MPTTVQDETRSRQCVCGGVKAPRSLRCRSCSNKHIAQNRPDRNLTARVCPGCGGQKGKASARCRQCWMADNGQAVDSPARKFRLKASYGITQADYDMLFELQGGVCAACKRPQVPWLDIDHDHVTGAVRGLLCHACNTALGHARDDVTILAALITYLEVTRAAAAVH